MRKIRRLRQRRGPIGIRAVGVGDEQDVGLARKRRRVVAVSGNEDVRAPVAIEVAGDNFSGMYRARQGACPEELAGDVDDNKPLGGAERDSFRGDDGGFDGGFDDAGDE